VGVEAVVADGDAHRRERVAHEEQHEVGGPERGAPGEPDGPREGDRRQGHGGEGDELDARLHGAVVVVVVR
jgi:hypothetical protein